MSEERETAVAEQVSVVIDSEIANLPGLSQTMEVARRQLAEWVNDVRGQANPGMLGRERYKDTDDVFVQMRQAKRIVATDETVGNALEITEGLAFQGVKWESADWDTQDVFNQMAAEQNLDELVRKIWREEFTVSQVVVATWWGYGEFSVRGETESGNKRKKKMRVYYPQRLTILDSSKVVPVGNLHFGMERLAWAPTPMERDAYVKALAGGLEDPMMERFYMGLYTPNTMEQMEIAGQITGMQQNGDPTGVKQLIPPFILLAEDAVSRHTLTKADYERWAPVRLKSIFHLIDLKQHLMAADRVALVGAANYILLVKKGDKDLPAVQQEIDHLKQNFSTLARIPVIFSDHRLEIEIISPKQDFTMQREKYDLVDTRIMQRLLNAMPGRQHGGNAEESVQLGPSVKGSLEGRRDMIRRYLEWIIARAVVQHPANADLFPEGPPSLSYFPANIVVTDNASIAQQVISLRTMNEISRETTLEFFGWDQQVEAMRRAVEEKKYDDTFQTQVPFSAQNGAPPVDQGAAGGQGGRPEGGGKRPQNPTKTQVTKKGNTSTGSDA